MKNYRALPTLSLLLIILAAVAFTVNAQKAELLVRAGHTGGANSTAFSPDGKLVASASSDKTIKFWDAETGRELKTLKGQTAVFSIAFSPDGKILASGSHDKTVKFWNVETGKEIRTLVGHTNGVTSIAFSPDGRTFASGGPDGSIRLWDVETGNTLKVFQKSASAVWCIAYSPDGKTLASAGVNNLSLWDVSSGTELKAVMGGTTLASIGSGSVSFFVSIAFSPDGKTLALADFSREKIGFWDVATLTAIGTFDQPDMKPFTVAFSPDGKTLVTGGDDKIRFWDMGTGKNLLTQTSGNVSTYSIKFSPDGKKIAYAGDNELAVRTITGEVLWAAGKAQLEIRSVIVSPDKETFAFSDNEGQFTFWDPLKSEIIEKKEDDIPAWAKAANPTASYGEFILQADGTNVKLLDRTTKNTVATLFLVGKNEWVVVDSEQRVDFSQGAAAYVNYLFPTPKGEVAVTLSETARRVWVPGLLQKILKGGPLPKAAALTSRDLVPSIEFEPFKPGLKQLKITLSNRGGGIGPVRIIVNGREFIKDARPPGFDSNSPEALITVDLSKAPIKSGQANKIGIVADNAAGQFSAVGRRDAEIIYNDTGTIQTRAPHIYIIAGGVSEYRNPVLNLRYAAKDAEDFAGALAAGAANLFGPDNVHIRLLIGDNAKRTVKFGVPDAKITRATRYDFLSAFTDFQKAATSNDIFLVYLAGNAVSFDINPLHPESTFLFLTEDATTSDEAVLSSLEKVRRNTTLSSDELAELLKRTSALKQVLILDTCHAGSVMADLVRKPPVSPDQMRAIDRLKDRTGIDLPSDQIRAIDRLKDRTGVFVLMGASAGGVALESADYGHGLLTYSLLEAMKGAKLTAGGLLSVTDLFAYAEARVPGMSKSIQRPVYVLPAAAADFYIGRFTEEEQRKIYLPVPKPVVLRPEFQNADLKSDNLKLTQLLQTGLHEKNHAATGSSARFIFVDTNEMADGIVPVGSYRIENDRIDVDLVLLQNNTALARTTVTGSTGDLAGLSLLIIKSIEKLVGELGSNGSKLTNKRGALRTPSPVPEIPSARNEPPPAVKPVFKPASFSSDLPADGEKIKMIRPRCVSAQKPPAAVEFEKELVKFLTATFGEGKNEKIEYLDVDDLQDAVRLEWSYEEDESTSTVQAYFSKGGEKISDSKDVTSQKGMTSLLTAVVSKWISTSTNSLSLKTRGTETYGLSTNIRRMLGKQYALLIATNDYEWLDKLNNPILDVCMIAKILRERYGFETEVVVNKTRTEIMTIIRQYAARSYEENSELLIFIAGHGAYDPLARMGYLAGRNSAKNDENFETYIPFPVLTQTIDSINIEHIWLVVDTCNAGLITKDMSRKVEGKLSKEEFVKDRLRGKTRMALAATEGEKYVSDGQAGKHSPFARDFIDVLMTDGGHDGNGILITSEFATPLFENIQKPRFGRLSADDAPGSDFVLLLLDEVERKKREVAPDIQECKCTFQKYNKIKYVPAEVCEEPK